MANQADRCPFPGCVNTSSHRHSKPKGLILPSIEEYRRAGEVIREQWSEKQRRQIAENEAMLRRLAETEPKVGDLLTKTHLPRGNDLTVQEQINIIHGGATPAQYEAFNEMLLEQQRQDTIGNTSPIFPAYATGSGAPQTEASSHSQAEQQSSVEWDDFPELDAKYGHPPSKNSRILDPKLKSLPKSLAGFSYNGDAGGSLEANITPKPHPPSQKTDFLYTKTLLSTGPCPVQTSHSQGPYLQQGQVPRTWNPRWGYSDPPREIWEAWARVQQGCGRTWDLVRVDGFALSHSWAGPSDGR